MAKHFEIKGRRGVLSLFYEGDSVAFNVTEYERGTENPGDRTSEMFVPVGRIEELIQQLLEMRTVINDRLAYLPKEVANQLEDFGVTEEDPSGVSNDALQSSADLMESVALFYLKKAADIRNPELPF